MKWEEEVMKLKIRAEEREEEYEEKMQEKDTYKFDDRGNISGRQRD